MSHKYHQGLPTGQRHALWSEATEIKLTLVVCHDILPRLDDIMLQLRLQFLVNDPNFLIPLRPTTQRGFRNMVARGAIDDHHIERRGGTPLLHVPGNRDAVQTRTAEKQALQLGRIAVVIEVDGPISREEIIKGFDG